MASEYTTIKVKTETLDKLKTAAALLNGSGDAQKIVTVAGLVTRLAEGYERHMTRQTIAGNTDTWILDGYPVILDSDAAKHFEELRTYYPVDCSVMVAQYIRNLAMTERFSKQVKA